MWKLYDETQMFEKLYIFMNNKKKIKLNYIPAYMHLLGVVFKRANT